MATGLAPVSTIEINDGDEIREHARDAEMLAAQARTALEALPKPSTKKSKKDASWQTFQDAQKALIESTRRLSKQILAADVSRADEGEQIRGEAMCFKPVNVSKIERRLFLPVADVRWDDDVQRDELIHIRADACDVFMRLKAVAEKVNKLFAAGEPIFDSRGEKFKVRMPLRRRDFERLAEALDAETCGGLIAGNAIDSEIRELLELAENSAARHR